MNEDAGGIQPRFYRSPRGWDSHPLLDLGNVLHPAGELHLTKTSV